MTSGLSLMSKENNAAPDSDYPAESTAFKGNDKKIIG